MATAAAAFAKTPAGQRFRQKAEQRVAELIKKGEGFVDRLSAKARQRMRDGAESNGQARGDTMPRARRGRTARGGATRGGATRGGATPVKQSSTLGRPSLGGATTTSMSSQQTSDRSGLHDVPDWQNKLKMKSVRGSKPIVNPGSHRGRAADR